MPFNDFELSGKSLMIIWKTTCLSPLIFVDFGRYQHVQNSCLTADFTGSVIADQTISVQIATSSPV